MKNSGVRKAAVFLSGLDSRTALELMERLDPASRKALRREMLELERIPEAAVEESVTEFIRTAADAGKQWVKSENSSERHFDSGSGTACLELNEGTTYERPKPKQRPESYDVFESSGHELKPQGYREYDEFAQGVETLVSARPQVDPLPCHGESTTEVVQTEIEEQRAFDFLRETRPEHVYRAIFEERPQTIALVLANLPPRLAGEVLAIFHEQEQSEIVRRLMHLEEADNSVIREIETVLRERISPELLPSGSRNLGFRAVKAIIDASDPNLAKRILASMKSTNPEIRELAPETPRRLRFDDLAALSHRQWMEVFKSVDYRIALLSLIGADPAVLKKIVSRFSREEELALRGRLGELGQVTEQETETAREIVLDTVIRLFA